MDFLSHFSGCPEKVRSLRGEILATPALPDPVQHSRTGNCFPDALSLYSLLTIVLYCIPPLTIVRDRVQTSTAWTGSAPCRPFLLPRAIVVSSDLLKCGSSGCCLCPSRTPGLLSFFHHMHTRIMWGKVRKWVWDNSDYPCPCFRTPTARRWRSGRRTTPSSRMSTTCATPRWPSGWRMSRRYHIFISDPSLMIVDPWHCLTDGLGRGWWRCKF